MSYKVARNAYRNFLVLDQKAQRVLNEAACNQLGRILCRNGFMGQDGQKFDLISSHWTRWDDLYHNYRTINLLDIMASVPINFSIGDMGVNGLVAALRAFSLRVLAAGHIEKTGLCTYNIHVERLGIFLWDTFNFAKESDWLASRLSLGFWNEKDFSPNIFSSKHILLSNSDFNSFRDKYNVGGDFLVLTKPHEVENFRGAEYKWICRKRQDRNCICGYSK